MAYSVMSAEALKSGHFIFEMAFSETFGLRAIGCRTNLITEVQL